jgi:hypothetical protein
MYNTNNLKYYGTPYLKSNNIVYHGSSTDVRRPIPWFSTANKDFSQGFYCTELPNQALEWACKRFPDSPTVNVYKLHDISDLRVRMLMEYNESWLDFILESRHKRKHKLWHSYDVVIGPMADSNLQEEIYKYRTHDISYYELLEKLQFKKPTNQLCFSTNKAVERLEYLGVWRKPL